MAPRPTPPLDLEELAELAKRFAEREMHDEAADLYRLALRLDPKNLGLKLSLAQLRRLQKQGQAKPRSRRELVREELRRDAIDAAHFLGLAHLYAEKGENGRALECLEIAKAKSLSDPAPYKLLGRILFRRGDYPGAAAEFQTALRLNPFDRETAEALGRVDYERREFKSALAATIDAFLLLNDADGEGAQRLKKRIRTLRQLLGWSNNELVRLFHARQEDLRLAFERLEWRRELFQEQGAAERRLALGAVPDERAGGQIELAVRLRQLDALSHVTDEQLFDLTRVVATEFCDQGELVFAHGSEGTDLYFLESGEVTIRRPTPYGTYPLGVLKPGDLFGEANFVTRTQRGGEALATKPSHLLRVDAEKLAVLVRESPELGVQLYWSLWHGLAHKLRSTNEQLKTFFEGEANSENFLRLRRGQAEAAGGVQVDSDDKIRLFREQGLSGKELEGLATFSREKRFPAGAVIFHEGDQASEMYVILEGRARISKFIPGGGEEALAILERGDFFGELSLIDGQPRSADARAHGGPVTVLALDQPTVHEVLAMDPQASLDFLQLLCRLVAKRLREIDEKVIGWRILAGERTETA